MHIARAGRLYPTPLPNNLFSIEEGHLLYDVQVEQDQPEEDVPEEDEEQGEEQEVPDEEEQPPKQYATYQDFHALEATIESMNDLALNLRDTTQNLSSHFAYWSTNNFPPPSQ